MIKYYDSYRASVIADALPGFTDFAKNTPTKSSQFETFSDYLTFVTNSIATAINKDHKQDALRWIKEHQFAVKSMFEKMVEGYNNPFEYGWKSYKFSRTVVEFDKFILVPTVQEHDLKETRPVIYGSEIEMLIGDTHSEIIASKILETKQQGPCFMKLHLADRRLKRYNLADMNKEIVVDWTGVL